MSFFIGTTTKCLKAVHRPDVGSEVIDSVCSLKILIVDKYYSSNLDV